MKKQILFITLLMTYLGAWSQKPVKDTLYFKFDTNYIETKKNYEEDHVFMFKKEKLVTSAFGEIMKEDMFHFSQSKTPVAVSKLNYKKIYKLKTYLKKRENIFKDKVTKKMDAYKLMKYFNSYTVFFLLEKKFIQVSALTSLYE